MNWRFLTRRDIAGILVTIIILGLLFFAYLKLPFFVGGTANLGFGPEWECTNPYNSGPVCIKKRPAKTDTE